MTSAAANRPLALAWLNYMLEPDVSALLIQRQGLANTLTPSPESNINAHLVWTRPVADVQQREALWNKIVSGDLPETFK
jgi:putative spermidine/putrescine transport system substrate-binding protein